MGTFTILNIIEKSNLDFNKIIICSNNNYEILRRKMNKLGFLIELEEIVKEKNKFYNIIIFKKGKAKYTDKEYFIGVNHTNKKLLNEKTTFLIQKYNMILNKVPLEKQTVLKKELDFLKE